MPTNEEGQQHQNVTDDDCVYSEMLFFENSIVPFSNLHSTPTRVDFSTRAPFSKGAYSVQNDV